MEKNSQWIVLGSGCFWGAQDLLRKIPGVLKTDVGYSGGDVPNVQYPQVKTGKTGHAEAVRVEWDPAKVSLDKILDVFFRMHDPTTEDRQGNDIGSQYRSVIYYTEDSQRPVISDKILQIEQLGFWKKPVVTQVLPFRNYYLAEEEHQDYLLKHPQGYSCHFMRNF